MPCNGTARGGSSAANNRHDVLNAAQYRCSVGGEWKPRSSFSQRNHNLLEKKVKIGMRVSPAKTGMTCRDHMGEPKLERQCEGPCNQVKTLADFSKSSLSKHINWCQACIKWQVSQDDYQKRKPAETTESGKDNDGAYGTGKNRSTPADSNEDDEQSVVASTRSAMLSTPTFSNAASGRLLPAASRTSGSIPPHLRSFKDGSDGDFPLSNAEFGNRYQADDASIVPDDSASQFAGPSQFEPSPTRLTEASLRQREQSVKEDKTPAYFNSWDNSGRQHMQRRTGAGSEVGTVRSFGTRVTGVGPFEDRRSQATVLEISRSETSGRSGKWAKMPHEPQPPPPIPEWTENEVHIDDDGSEPDLP